MRQEMLTDDEHVKEMMGVEGGGEDRGTSVRCYYNTERLVCDSTFGSRCLRSAISCNFSRLYARPAAGSLPCVPDDAGPNPAAERGSCDA